MKEHSYTIEGECFDQRFPKRSRNEKKLCDKSHKMKKIYKISTHLLTVLTISVITFIEQRNRRDREDRKVFRVRHYRPNAQGKQ